MNLRYQLERFGFWIARSLARIIPRSIFLKLGEAFGSFAYYIDTRHRKVAISNYLKAFPNATPAEAASVIQKCYRWFSYYLFDMLTCFSRLPDSRMGDFEYEGVEYLEEAYRAGKGIILYGGHFGAWELMALAHGAREWPLDLVVRRLDNPYLENMLTELRTSTGNGIIDKKQGFRPMLKALREGKGVAVLMDQNVSTEDRIFVDFFGMPASTTPSVALLKIKTGASLISVHSYPLLGNRYRFVYGPPVEVPLTGKREVDVQKITQECTRTIETFVRQHPECWLWMHRRWKTQPKEKVLA